MVGSGGDSMKPSDIRSLRLREHKCLTVTHQTRACPELTEPRTASWSQASSLGSSPQGLLLLPNPRKRQERQGTAYCVS